MKASYDHHLGELDPTAQNQEEGGRWAYSEKGIPEEQDAYGIEEAWCRGRSSRMLGKSARAGDRTIRRRSRCSTGKMVKMKESSMESSKDGRRVAKPVTHKGVRYEQIKAARSRGFGQNGGILVAVDVASGKELWTLQLYQTIYDPNEETDAQDVVPGRAEDRSQGRRADRPRRTRAHLQGESQGPLGGRVALSWLPEKECRCRKHRSRPNPRPRNP